jgi:2-polyprenyl-3-methyl-5-hydroxy-6-metoxy-1,4-benzoquinol methylase
MRHWSSSSGNTKERGLKTHFNLTASEYERLRKGHLGRRRRQIVEEALASRVAPGAQVIEVGCGPGALLAELATAYPEVEFLGVDVEPKMVIHARDHHARNNVHYELVDLAEERPGVTADFAYSIDLLHHIRDLRAFLEGLHDVLRPGATWLAIEPNVFHPYIFWSQARMLRAGYDEDHFRPWVVEPNLREAGFDVSERRYAFFFPGWIERVPALVAWVEPLLERFRLLGGSVVYRLERRSL